MESTLQSRSSREAIERDEDIKVKDSRVEWLQQLATRAAAMPAPEWLSGMYDGHFMYYRFFYLLAQELRPWLCVELGTFVGVAAMCLARGNPKGRVVAIDINHSEISDSCRLENIDFRKHDSLEVDGDLKDIELLYIDAEHTLERPKAEFEAWESRLKTGAVVFFDDLSLNEGMKQFWAGFEPVGYTKVVFPGLHGLAGFGAIL